jgi:uncharacterized protein (DUF302 family)
MSYQYTISLRLPFEEVMQKIESRLESQGFTMMSSLDVKHHVGSELGVKFRNYAILSVCIPEMCYRAISLEPRVGIVLPCNIVIQEHENGSVEICGINPLETMDANMVTSSLETIAAEVSVRLRAAIDALQSRRKVTEMAYN